MKSFYFLLSLCFVQSTLFSQIQDTIKNYKWVNGQWQFSSIQVQGTNNSCLVDTSELRGWDESNSAFTNSSRRIYTYNTDGTISSLLWDKWDGGTNTWKHYYRYTSKYNSFQRVVSQVSEYFDDQGWHTNHLDTFTYNLDGFLIERGGLWWNSNTNSWDNGDRQVFTLRQDGLPTQMEFASWKNGSWNNFAWQTMSYYDGTKLLRETIDGYSYPEWTMSGKAIYTYDEKDLVKNSVNQIWNGDWQNSFTQSYIRNDDGTVKEYYYQTWDNANSSWVNGNFQTISYTSCALPMTLTKFTVVNKNSDAIITWQTSTEINSDYFEIQRSLDNVNYTTIAKIKSKGSNGITTDYEYKDDLNALPAGRIVYRLKQMDKDGRFSYSKNVSINHQGKIAFTFLPNPATKLIKVMFADNGTDLEKQIIITDMSGRQVYKNKASSSMDIDVSSLSTGTYIISVLTSLGKQSQLVSIQ